MLKFFRRIRRKLIEEGNLKKYLIYAVGEIALIVIGILVALQIDNWNEAGKLSEKEQVVLKDLYEDLESNSLILRKDIRQNKEMIDYIDYILGHFDNDLAYSDSLADYLPMMAWTHQLTLVSSAFESLKSSGFDVIQSNELKLQIINLFDHEYNSTSRWINTLSIEKHREFREVFIEFPRGGISGNYHEILADDKLYNLLVTYKGWKEVLVDRENILLENTNKLKERVESEFLSRM
jgi:hypothetical protein